ncbi:MAG: hypothetical protein KDJ17_07220 [Hyphomicrobiaceae bacterium]|nr:hypothetical protein [Hyphomicrobiaceae bacterium]
METISAIAGALWSLLSVVLSLAWWVVSYLLWGMLWLLLPLLLVAFIGVRVAERAFGRETVRAWVKARTMRFGSGTWNRVRPWLFALGAAPFRVLVWFVIYAVWHACISILWTPRWTPWQRAWGKKWKDARPGAKANAK